MRRREWLAGLLAAAPPRRPGPRDLCPVCGMIVSKYPNWVAMVEWGDGQAQFFDGAKDLFRFLQGLSKYAPKRRMSELKRATVTEFYDLRPIEAREAYFVVGSDVLGPMGHELVALGSLEDAREFLADHKGKRIVRWGEVTSRLLDAVEAGRP